MTKVQMQDEFQGLISKYYELNKYALALEQPQFSSNGSIYVARFDAGDAFVEILTGPPNYRAEIFFQEGDLYNRRELADLQEDPLVMRWWEGSKYDRSKKTALESDIKWLFQMLVNALPLSEEYSWVSRA